MENDIKLSRYADITMDRWFKRSFGKEHERLLILFLEAVLPERRIASLTYVSQEHINPFPKNKDSRIDLECTDTSGARFIVEVQLSPQDFFHERALYYSTFSVQQQLANGKKEYTYSPVYIISLLKFSFHPGSDQVLFRYNLREQTTHELMTGNLEFIFLEMPNCKKALTPQGDVLDNFSYALMNMTSFKEKPEALSSEMFDLLFNSAEVANFTDTERKQYISDMRTERDFHNQLAFAKKEGARQEKEAIARKLLAGGMAPEDVAEVTGLGPQEIEKL